MNNFIRRIQQEFNKDFSLTALRVAIILWAIFVICLAIVVDNKWFLAGVLAYEVLP
jgi:hypothetical protein